jgi:uncharacterized membrane protein
VGRITGSILRFRVFLFVLIAQGNKKGVPFAEMVNGNAFRLRVTDDNDIGNDDDGARIASRAFFGFFFILFCDLLWLGVLSNWLGIYRPYIEQEDNSVTRMTVGLLSYAALAGGVSCVVVADSAGLAACGGALIGLWVFGAYNITTWATTSGRYTITIALCDTAYGVLTTAALFASQHAISSTV